MNDAEFEKQKARVQRYIDKWMPAGFGWWRIDFMWERSSASGFEGCTENANIIEHWQYRAATITFNLGATKDLTDERLEETVIHELSHLLLGSIRDYSTDAQRQMTEFAVTSVARALLWTHQFVKEPRETQP